MEFHDPIESCPYNILHRIRRSRMQFHITTCAQNHKHVQGMVQCPFDARHVIKRIEFEHHKKTCPARESVLNYADHDTRPQVQLRILPIDVKAVGKWHEKWDKDADVKSYNPIENIKNKPIVYPLIGVSKAKRKIHRLQERERYNRIKENSGISISRNSSYSESMNRSSKLNYLSVVSEIGESTNEQGYKPLRPPKKYVADNTIDKTVDKVTNHVIESNGYIPRNSEISSSASEIDETSNDSYSSASISSSSDKKYTSPKVPSEDFEIFKKVPREFNVAAANTKNQEKYVINDKISSVFEKDKYQFDAHQYEDQQKCSVPDLLSMASTMNGYQFEEYQCDDHEKCSVADAVSTVSSKDQYEFESFQSREREIYTIPDLIVSREDQYQFKSHQDNHQEKPLISDNKTYSVVSSNDEYGFEPYQYDKKEEYSISNAVSSFSKDDYQLEPHQYKDYEKSSIVDTVSVYSSKDEYGFKPYQYNEQEKCSIPDTFSITSKDNYQFELHHYKDYEKSSISDTSSIASTRNNYEFGAHQYRDYNNPTVDTFSIASNKDVHQFEAYQCNDQFPILDTVNTFSQDRYSNKGPEKYLSLSVDGISEINSEYNYIEDDAAVLSETIEKVVEKNENKKNYLMTDTVYDVFSDDESHYNVTTVSWNPDATPTSAENYETASESLSFETAESSFHCDSSTTRKPPQNVGLFGKLLQMIKGMTINDTGHKKKSESLNHSGPDKGKLFPRCGANFLNLK